MKITGYKEVSYTKFLEALNRIYWFYISSGEGNNIVLASILKIKSTQTIFNFLRKEKQSIKDSTLTHLMEILGFDGFIVWKEGKRLYYVNEKIK